MARLSRLLDTNVCVYMIRRRPPEVLRKFEDFEVGEIGISVITASELCYGVEKSGRPEQNREALDRFLLPLEVVSFGSGQVKARYGIGDLIDRDYVWIDNPYRYGLKQNGYYVRAGDYVYQVDRDTHKVLNLIGAVADILN